MSIKLRLYAINLIKLSVHMQLVELKDAEKQSLKESERLEKEIADVQELKKKLSTMTAEEYFAKHPELKKKFDDEIRNDYWGYQSSSPRSLATLLGEPF